MSSSLDSRGPLVFADHHSQFVMSGAKSEHHGTVVTNPKKSDSVCVVWALEIGKFGVILDDEGLTAEHFTHF